MTLLEVELKKLTVDQLRNLTASSRANVAVAAQAELDGRLRSQTEELRAAVFPPHPFHTGQIHDRT